MTATLSRIVLGSDGEVSMVIHPHDDAQLTNVPQFSPAGATWADVQRGTMSVSLEGREFWTNIQAVIAAKRQILGDLITQRIALIDAFQAFKDDSDLLSTRQTNWPTPTGAQQLLINAAKAQILSDLSAIQTARDNIANIKAQLG